MSHGCESIRHRFAPHERRVAAIGRRRQSRHNGGRAMATSMTAPDDLSTLMARVALQDRAAFERVYKATSAHLLGVALRILNSRERAEEVLQEIVDSVPVPV